MYENNFSYQDALQRLFGARSSPTNKNHKKKTNIVFFYLLSLENKLKYESHFEKKNVKCKLLKRRLFLNQIFKPK